MPGEEFGKGSFQPLKKLELDTSELTLEMFADSEGFKEIE